MADTTVRTGSNSAIFRLALLLVISIVFAGCLPSSCRRTESQEISPADSLSRQIASRITPDTLRLGMRLRGQEGDLMTYPRTVVFGTDGRLFVSDAERSSIYVFSPEGSFLKKIAWEGAAQPYIVGLWGDSLLVFNPEHLRIDAIVSGVPHHHISLPSDIPAEALKYVVATDTAIYIKIVGRDFNGYIAQLDDRGQVAARVRLSGSEWRHAGHLRTWGDTLVSLSGYFPKIDILASDLSSPPDSVMLQGFDSPMLRRTFRFLRGKMRQAPLLSSSATALGEWLFVLNMRPGWVRIDVYDRSGMLRHVLVDGEQRLEKNFYPRDIAVRLSNAGAYDIAVAMLNPTAEVRMYHWLPRGSR